MPLLKRAKKIQLPAKKKPVTVYDIVYENMATWGQVKKFLKRDVADSDVEKLLSAATMAHSTQDREPWEIIVVRKPEQKKFLAEATEEQSWMVDAPVILVLCANQRIAGAGKQGERGVKLYGIQDVAAAAQNIILAANALGLGSAWVGEFNEVKISLGLQMPEWIRPQVLIATGWPAEAPKENIRHRTTEVVHDEAFGKTRRSQIAWGHTH